MDEASADGLYTGALFLTHHDLARLAAAGLPPSPVSWLQSLAAQLEPPALDVGEPAPYVAEVRRRVRPLWCRVSSREEAARCTEALLQGAQKRTLDVAAWWSNRPLENWVRRRIADWPSSANQVSAIVGCMAFAATGLFLSAWLLPASLLTLVVNVLDGVDDKLAQVKGLTTRLGRPEHSSGHLYEQSWYINFC